MAVESRNKGGVEGKGRRWLRLNGGRKLAEDLCPLSSLAIKALTCM